MNQKVSYFNLENYDEIFEYLDYLSLTEKISVLKVYGRKIFEEKKFKTIKYLESQVIEIIKKNSCKNVDSEMSVSTATKSISFSNKNVNNEVINKGYFKSTSFKNLNQIVNEKIKYSCLLQIFDGYISQLEDFIEFVLKNDPNFEPEFIYK